MKLEHLTLRSFKRFDEFSLEIKNSAMGETANQFLILGDNGSGKTTILQAVALCLSMVSQRIRTIDDFDWLGWVPGRYRRWGTPQVELLIRFSDDEIEATREAADRWYRSRNHPDDQPYVQPPRENLVKIGLDGERYWVTDPKLAKSPPEVYLFRGRQYAASLLRYDQSARNLFEHLPGIFWFDQFRNLATPPGSRLVERENESHEERADMAPYQPGVNRLRRYLNVWKVSSNSRYAQIDYLMELETHYKRIFPGRSFSDLEPMFRGDSPSPIGNYFMFTDGN